MKKIITYGTFDLLHIGHIHLLRRARDLGDHLTVALSSDEFNAIKGKQTIQPFAERQEILRSLRYVDAVIPETCWEQKISDVQKHQIAIFVMGDDWQGKFDFLAPYCQVVYLPRTQHISSSQLKNDLNRLQTMQALLQKLKRGDIQDMIGILDKIINLK